MHARMPLELESSSQLPDLLQGYVSVRSKGGKPLFRAGLEDITEGDLIIGGRATPCMLDGRRG